MKDMKLSYSPESINDLMRLREFIEEKNPQAARRFATAIKKSINQLKPFPYLGVKPKKRSSHLLQRPKALHLKDFLNILASPVE